jgi:hypothetical protein
VRGASRLTLTEAMSGHNDCLRCGFRSGCKLLHVGLGKIPAVYRDRGTTLGALKDGLASVCYGGGGLNRAASMMDHK